MYPTSQPPVPYGPANANADPSKLVEDGFKSVRGSLTEGRYLTFEFGGYALTNPGKTATKVTATKATSSHNDIKQRWIVHSLTEGGNNFTISSAADKRYIGPRTSLVNSTSGAETYTVKYTASKGYALQSNGEYLSLDSGGSVQITASPANFELYSVTYSS
jgi:phospholipase C